MNDSSKVRILQNCIDMLAGQYVPALSGAKVIETLDHVEIWQGTQCLVAGSYPTALLLLGCIALTHVVCTLINYPPQVLHHVVRSGECAGVL